MQVLRQTQQLRDTINNEKSNGHTIALVPTMGNLHQGHLQLVKRAHEIADIVIASIFVNPMQFGANEDLDSYPKTPTEDIDKLEKEHTHYLFLPDAKEVYPNGIEQHTKVSITHMGSILCGKSRPVHFEGVCTVVSKLFNLVQPTHAVFGEKDFQQLAIIRRMTQDLCMPVEIVGVPTHRESNGLAMSSRNNYLTHDQKESAGLIHSLLQQTKTVLMDGSTNYEELCQYANDQLKAAGFEPDYFDIRNADDLTKPDTASSGNNLVVLVAAYLGDTRLIDNIYFSLVS